jgi:hypothetical protein
MMAGMPSWKEKRMSKASMKNHVRLRISPSNGLRGVEKRAGSRW